MHKRLESFQFVNSFKFYKKNAQIFAHFLSSFDVSLYYSNNQFAMANQRMTEIYKRMARRNGQVIKNDIALVRSTEFQIGNEAKICLPDNCDLNQCENLFAYKSKSNFNTQFLVEVDKSNCNLPSESLKSCVDSGQNGNLATGDVPLHCKRADGSVDIIGILNEPEQRYSSVDKVCISKTWIVLKSGITNWNPRRLPTTRGVTTPTPTTAKVVPTTRSTRRRTRQPPTTRTTKAVTTEVPTTAIAFDFETTTEPLVTTRRPKWATVRVTEATTASTQPPVVIGGLLTLAPEVVDQTTQAADAEATTIWATYEFPIWDGSLTLEPDPTTTTTAAPTAAAAAAAAVDDTTEAIILIETTPDGFEITAEPTTTTPAPVQYGETAATFGFDLDWMETITPGW